MTNPLTTDGFRNVALLLARVALGTYFLLAGFGKYSGGVRAFVNARAKTIPAFLPEELGRAYLFMLPTAELIVGVALVIGFYTRTAATLIALMLISFIIAVTGVGASGAAGWNIDKNLVYLGLALLLMSTGGGQISVDQSMGGGGGGSAPGPKKK
jgi:uncharacterized membrane protein YphA (DoxX/SURF4 family)